MKKTLIAVAALSAMAASAMAANVTLSGVVDFGLNYQHVKNGSNPATNSFTAKSGQNSGSRFMFKGSEDLGNGVEVGFQLENGFNSDDGTLSSSRIFHRETRLYVKTNFGTLHFGRFGGLDAGTGSVSIFGGSDLAAFGTGWGSTIGAESAVLKGISARYDNMIAYESPKFAGFSLHLAHSFKNDSSVKGDEGRPSADQYNAAGLKYVNGAFNAAFVYSQQNYGNFDTANETDNSHAYSLGVGYNFGVCKLMVEGQYFDMGKYMSQKTTTVSGTSGDVTGSIPFTTISSANGQKGWGGIVSVTAPVAGGTIYGSVGYKDAEDAVADDVDYKLWNIALGYSYSFSKRTTVYAAAGYTEDKTETTTTSKKKTSEVAIGLVHKF